MCTTHRAHRCGRTLSVWRGQITAPGAPLWPSRRHRACRCSICLVSEHTTRTQSVSWTTWAGGRAIYSCSLPTTGETQGPRQREINRIKRSLSMKVSISFTLPLNPILYTCIYTRFHISFFLSDCGCWQNQSSKPQNWGADFQCLHQQRTH